MSTLSLRPSECRVSLSFLGCAELEESLRDALAQLIAAGDTWDSPIAPPTELWAWKHGHPDGTRCDFARRCLDGAMCVQEAIRRRLDPYEFSVDWSAGYRRTWAECPLLKDFSPQRWIEIGLHEGRSAVHTIARMPRGGFFYGVDPWVLGNDVARRCSRNIWEASQLHGITYDFLDFTADALDGFRTRGDEGKFDGGYLDGPKDYGGAKVATIQLLRLVKSGGPIVFDDVHWDEKAREIRLDWISPVGRAVLDATGAALEAFVRCGHQWVYRV